MLLLALRGERQLDSGTTFEQLVSLSHCWSARAANTAPTTAQDDNSTDDLNTNLYDTSTLLGNAGVLSSGFTNNLLNMLWIDCFSQCSSVLKKFDSLRLQRLYTFILTIKNPKIHSHSKKSGVKFTRSNADAGPASKLIPGIISSPKSLSSSTAYSQGISILDQFTGTATSIEHLVSLCHELYCISDDPQHKLQYMTVLVGVLDVFSVLDPYMALLPVDDRSSCSNSCRVLFIERVLVPVLSEGNYELTAVLVECWQAHLLALEEEHQATVLSTTLVSTLHLLSPQGHRLGYKVRFVR